jgi:hypothetical protein
MMFENLYNLVMMFDIVRQLRNQYNSTSATSSGISLDIMLWERFSEFRVKREACLEYLQLKNSLQDSGQPGHCIYQDLMVSSLTVHYVPNAVRSAALDFQSV